MSGKRRTPEQAEARLDAVRLAGAELARRHPLTEQQRAGLARAVASHNARHPPRDTLNRTAEERALSWVLPT